MFRGSQILQVDQAKMYSKKGWAKDSKIQIRNYNSRHKRKKDHKRNRLLAVKRSCIITTSVPRCRLMR